MGDVVISARQQCATTRVHGPRPGATFQSYGLDANTKIASASSHGRGFLLTSPFMELLTDCDFLGLSLLRRTVTEM